MIGQTVSHYKIIEKLGEGGMGVVYKARDTKLDRTVALKFLPPHISINKQEKKRFVHEAKAAAALDHQNICAIYEINETDDGQIFLAMGFYKGQTLKEKIEQRPLPVDEALGIAIQISNGLQEAHESHIVHRDIKSDNIMLTEKGQVKILDFGLAKLKGVTKLTKEGTTLGTVSYMSPEQAAGEAVDQRTDCWSLGVVLYEMLTGQLPFGGHYEQAIMYAIMNEEPKPVTGLRTGIPLELERIITKILAKDPCERYQSMADLLVDLKKVKRDSKPGVIPIRKKTSPEITLKASRKALVLVTLFLVTVVVTAYFIFRSKPKTDIPPVEPGNMPSLAVVYFENNSGDKNLDNWRQAFSELLTTDLAQSRYMKVLRSDEVFGIFKKLNLLEAKRYSTQDLKEVARNGGVNHILRGSYLKDEDHLVITAALLNADTGETISSLSVRSKKGEIFTHIDDMTRKIKSKLNLTAEQISQDLDRDIGQITTSSPEALEYYIQGMRYKEEGEYQKAIASLKKAIEKDPRFAMAYLFLAKIYDTHGYLSESNQSIQKAHELSEHLSERERYTIQGEYYSVSEKTWDRSVEAYKKVLKLYPDDEHVNLNLGLLYRQLEEFDRAIERFNVLIQAKSKLTLPYYHLNATYQQKGWYEKGNQILNLYLNHFHDHQFIRLGLAENYMSQRKFEKALKEMEKALSFNPQFWPSQTRKAMIYFYMGDFRESEKIFDQLMEDTNNYVQVNALFSKGNLKRAQGKITEAETLFKQAIAKTKEKIFKKGITELIGYLYFLKGEYDQCLSKLSYCLEILRKINDPRWEMYTRYFIAITYLEINAADRAQKAGKDILKWANDRQNKKLIRFYHLFQGQKELGEKHFTRAIDSLNQAIALLPHSCYIQTEPEALFFDALARAYLQSGNLSQAQNWFEKITTLTFGRTEWGEIYAKAFYHLGKIYQQKGWKGKAVDAFNQFINLWKDCDPIFQPLVKDARERVEALNSTQS